jgi:hypothetical protein
MVITLPVLFTQARRGRGDRCADGRQNRSGSTAGVLPRRLGLSQRFGTARSWPVAAAAEGVM